MGGVLSCTHFIPCGAACGRGEVAPRNGTFTIQVSTVKDNTQINGIEILS